MSLIYLWFILAGAFAGLCAGLFGVGGGMIIVPALMWIFTSAGYSVEIVTHMAVGTSLATIVVTSISSLMAHHKLGNVRWDIFRNMTIGLMIGSLLGAAIAERIHGVVLAGMIGVWAVAMGIKMLLAKKSSSETHRQLPNTNTQFLAGTGIGITSAIFGIGGGSLTVPFLNYCGLAIKQSVGTSSACGLPIAIAGAIGFALFGQNVSGLPAETIGFVHVSAFVCISVVSFLMAKVGAKLANKLPALQLKRYFGILLIVAGGKMLMGIF